MVSVARRGVIAAGAVVAAVALVSCSEETGGTPQTPGAQTSEQQAVPPVASPLSADQYLGKPCDLIARSEVKALGSEEQGEPDVDSDMARNLTGPTCTWNTRDGWFDVAVATVHRDKAAENLKGIAGIYAEKAGLAEFQPVEIPGSPGYPAVIAREDVDISGGSCPVYVGIANDLTFIAGMKNRTNPDIACQDAIKVASAVMDTLKKGA